MSAWAGGASGRLLGVRTRRVAATIARLRRRLRGPVRASFSDEERALVDLLRPSADGPTVALATELDELGRLRALEAAAARGDERASEALVDWCVASEHVRELMPRGRLPRDPLPSVRRLLDRIQRELTARLVIQIALESRVAPPGSGALALSPVFAPSWGHTRCSLLLGAARALLVARTPLPSRWRYRWDRAGYTLSAPGIRVAGAWSRPGEWTIQAPAAQVLLVPRAAGWPLLPPIVDEDGPSRTRPRTAWPAPGARAHAGSIFARAADQTERIEGALEVLGAAWPKGLRTVVEFTRAIIPVTQRQVVSYSFAPVPGWSYLNLYDRDFIDLVDDLCHENAHHHLNHLEAEAPLVVPMADEPLLYYSPWRESLRPVRGILHSVFTFSVGAELFRRLFVASRAHAKLPRRFSAAERARFAGRCLEETAQIRYSLVDLEDAARAGRLTARGHALVRAIARAVAGLTVAERGLRAAIRGTRWHAVLARLDALLALQARRRARREAGAA